MAYDRGDLTETTSDVVFIVTREPFEPAVAFSEGKTPLAPFECWSVEAAFQSERDADAFALTQNVRLYAETYQSRLNAEELATARAMHASTDAPPGTYMRCILQMLQAKLTIPLQQHISTLTGGFRVVPTELVSATRGRLNREGAAGEGSGAARAACVAGEGAAKAAGRGSKATSRVQGGARKKK